MWSPPLPPSKPRPSLAIWSCSRPRALAGWSGSAKHWAGVKKVEVMIQPGAPYVNDLLPQPIFIEIGGRYPVGRPALGPALVSVHYLSERGGGGDRAAVELVAWIKSHWLAEAIQVRTALSGQ